MKIAYFAYDLNDPAARKRVAMLHAGGAQVCVIGFHRKEAPPQSIDGAPVIDLGRTFDGRLAHRAWSVLRHVLSAGRLAAAVADSDVVMARNLEMLAIAARVRAIAAPKATLVYECLDIHRSLLGSGPASRVLRALERALMKHASLLVVSSPAFLRDYFARQGRRDRNLLVENKVLDLGEPPQPRPRLMRPAAPWRIGWFGMIRCSRSLAILSRLAAAADGQLEVIIRGRPAYTEFDDFDAQVAAAPHVSFEGPYRAADLADHYAQVHFVWGLDYFEEGLNSAWLLPNRLYEGAFYGAAPIALKGVETGAWLVRHKAGVLLGDPEAELADFFANLTAADYQALQQGVWAIPDDDLRFDRHACRGLVGQLASLAA
jgi:succinoglycan biosynthesis protein ExoL